MRRKLFIPLTAFFFCSMFTSGCSSLPFFPNGESVDTIIEESASYIPSESVFTPMVPGSESFSSNQTTLYRDNTPSTLMPIASGKEVYSNDYAEFDVSNASCGYVMARYFGSSTNVKLQITGSDSITYTYNLCSSAFEAFPLSSESGTYKLCVYEHIENYQYALVFSKNIFVSLDSEFGPYLYPNQYVDFTPESLAVAKAASLTTTATSDLDVVSTIYNYIINNFTYDKEVAAHVESGYLCDIDHTLTAKTGICLDFATLMTCMLRSQNIPTRLEVGYADTAYHAWLSTYITDIGWVNNIVKFDGTGWKLMDPTFAMSSSEKNLKKFIGDGSNYTVKYMY